MASGFAKGKSFANRYIPVSRDEYIYSIKNIYNIYSL